MDYVELKKGALQEKYAYWLNEAKGGIFRKSARKKMLGLSRLPAKGQPRNSWWYKKRLYVDSALVDLAIFLQAAGPSNVDHVVSLESLKPIIDAIFWSDITEPNADIVDSEKAIIAQYMIDVGFSYLERINPHYIGKLAYRVIDDAKEVSRYLTAISLPDEERELFGTWLEQSEPSDNSEVIEEE